jgi:hypothetical protein
MIEYIIGILALAIVGVIVYRGVTKTADKVIGEPPVQPKSTKLSKARLTALTKAQLLEKSKELGIDVDKKTCQIKNCKSSI